MNDKQLTILAAQAIKLEGEWIDGFGYRVPKPESKWEDAHHYWSPLTDDGDALQLAVKLRIEIEPWIHGDEEWARTAVLEVLIDEPHNDDPYAATRRAIVKAAAEIGREMK